jgi:hypothetical protein
MIAELSATEGAKITVLVKESGELKYELATGFRLYNGMICSQINLVISYLFLYI